MKMTIERSTFKEVEPLIKLARKEGMRVHDVPGSVWFYAKVDGEMAGFVSCYIREKHGKAVFKSDYVREGYRRRGIYRKLFETRLAYVRNFNVKLIKASCTKMSLGCFLSYGFTKTETRSRKYTDVVMNVVH
ncbi:GNAT family N-acetyltransferase [Bacillus sp. Marseille-Q1617]|uniref:GNAT family N-acetyltransferase n=1 Tax=Bacillus sp. Marseille-Q1617 TaxID=2736887 RepID=UPI00158E7ED2|nr:GNAT family N-acetyltransferase [Bacillus sp. Marseille-Q1617]